MKVTMYGTELCPDCVTAKAKLMERTDIELEYKIITEKISTLKEFLAYRDHEAMFAPMIAGGKVGIPFFILEDGTKTLELSDFLESADSVPTDQASSCSIDGKGNC